MADHGPSYPGGDRLRGGDLDDHVTFLGFAGHTRDGDGGKRKQGQLGQHLGVLLSVGVRFAPMG